jgi:hypothetical protein
MALKWYGPQVDAAITAAAVTGLNTGAQKVTEDTIKRAPHETGALRASFKIEPATAGNLEAAVYSDNPYAVYQHEIISYRRRIGGPKFLENAANAYEKQFRADMMQALADAGGV